jgi:uncharacterized protein
VETIKEKINAALKDAMKNKDNDRRDVIRLLTSAIKQVEIDSQKDVTDEQTTDILIKEAKKRRETITELNAANRPEQAQKEEYELSVIEEFLPKQLTQEEIVQLIKDAIASSGATSGKEMGKVMGILQPQTKGRADGKLVSQLVKELLG